MSSSFVLIFVFLSAHHPHISIVHEHSLLFITIGVGTSVSQQQREANSPVSSLLFVLFRTSFMSFRWPIPKQESENEWKIEWEIMAKVKYPNISVCLTGRILLIFLQHHHRQRLIKAASNHSYNEGQGQLPLVSPILWWEQLTTRSLSNISSSSSLITVFRFVYLRSSFQLLSYWCRQDHLFLLCLSLSLILCTCTSPSSFHRVNGTPSYISWLIWKRLTAPRQSCSHRLSRRCVFSRRVRFQPSYHWL